MEITEQFIIKLELAEAEALKLIVGIQSHDAKKSLGLTDEQSEAMLYLFTHLPFAEKQ